jgi:hypothetical protein
MWIPQDTTTHQDHVIAHVVGSTVLGHFSFDESIYLLLDIGFIWQIYLDGGMGLLPWTLAIQELEVDEHLKRQLKTDAELLLSKGIQVHERVTPAPVECRIEEVSFFLDGDDRLLILHGEGSSLTVETSILTRTINLNVKAD